LSALPSDTHSTPPKQSSTSNVAKRSHHSQWTWSDLRIVVAALICIPLFLIIDSPFVDELMRGYSQWLANALVLIAFIIGYQRSSKRVRHILLIGIVVGMGGEILFSLVLGLYHYRLGNVPLWVALAHGLIFALVYRITHKPSFVHHSKNIQVGIVIFAVLYSVFWLIWQNDVYGFVCTVLFLAILSQAKRSRLFFLVMFVVVCYIEQVGTLVDCWWWPETISGIDFLPASGNPPTGISVFYFLFDWAVFMIYLHIFNRGIKVRYQRRYG
jgi:hypothetical protein